MSGKTSNIDVLLNRAADHMADPFANINVGDALAQEIRNAIARRAAKLIRYCPECGSIGEVVQPALNCCPDGSRAVRLPPAIAEQAHFGFHARLMLAEGVSGDVDAAVLKTILPECYRLINDILETSGETIPKARVIEARKLLPGQYSQSITRGKTR